MDVMHGVASEASQIVTDGASCTLLSLLNEVNIDHRVCGVSGMGGSLGSQTCRLRKAFASTIPGQDSDGGHAFYILVLLGAAM
ncbi:hypothetical protein IPC86_19785 [Pseudomonas aeruginosa]|nr:hypothetical protein BZY58_06535 [Pseudomonas aeruginosa]RMK74659.1 hypothetical protein IPC86_19785 [Pseudomonas aeruginosa]